MRTTRVIRLGLVIVALLMLPAFATAQPVVTCQFDPFGDGDLVDRGFYVPNFPTSSLGRVQLRFASDVSGEFVFALTARDGAYNGPIIGTAIEGVALSGSVMTNHEPVVSFHFYGVPVTPGHTVAFAITKVRTPSNADVYWDNGVDGSCSPAVWETVGTTPPLSVQRRASMGLTIYAPEPVYANTNTYWIPVVSHGTGAANSQWRSDVKLLNRGAAQANVTMTLMEGGNPGRVIVIPGAGADLNQVTINDVVPSLDGAFTGSAALQISSDQPLTVESRNYTVVASDAACTPSGTFGQLFDAHTPGMGFIAGQTAYLVGLAENSAFRTNIGLTNIGSTPAQATVSLCDPAGSVLATYDVSLAHGEWKQAYRPFNGYAHRTDLTGCYAKVAITAGNGVIVYGSVADWLTNDATTVMGRL